MRGFCKSLDERVWFVNKYKLEEEGGEGKSQRAGGVGKREKERLRQI